MRILLDEDVPIQALDILRRVLVGHGVVHVTKLRWRGKKDRFLIADAAAKNFDVFVTNNRRQLTDPDECAAIKQAGIHHVRYDQAPGLRGLALAVAAIVAAMPGLMEELEQADAQRLVKIQGLDVSHRRYEVTDPRKNPPNYWPR